jgi:hypothetical protein
LTTARVIVWFKISSALSVTSMTTAKPTAALTESD